MKSDQLARGINPNPLRRFLSKRGVAQVITVTCGWLLLMFVFSLMSNVFLTPMNMGNLLRQIAPILIIGIGQSYVLITGNIDLSIGSVVGMSCMISATLMVGPAAELMGLSPIAAVAIAYIACLTIGLINGLLVSWLKLPPFIATLGTMSIARGVAQLANNNYNTTVISHGVGQSSADAFQKFFYSGKIFNIALGPAKTGGTQTNVFPLYSAVLIAIVLWVVFNFILSKTRTGRHVYAIGSNIEAARLSGVSVIRTTTKVYMISAFCACTAGLVVMATTNTGTMDSGNTYELYAVASSVIGGVSTLGGQGILFGTIVGAAIWRTLENGLNMVGTQVGYQNITVGIIVIFSVLLDVLVRSGKRRRGGSSEKKGTSGPGGERTQVETDNNRDEGPDQKRTVKEFIRDIPSALSYGFQSIPWLKSR